MRLVFFLASGVLLGSLTAVEAADVFPGGAFGETSGCRYARTGESSGEDDFLLIDRQAITTAVAVCQIRHATMKGSARADLVLACESEGESGDDESAVATLKDGAWTVRLADGTTFGPARKCP